jgi:hypothetical protein
MLAGGDRVDYQEVDSPSTKGYEGALAQCEIVVPTSPTKNFGPHVNVLAYQLEQPSVPKRNMVRLRWKWLQHS